MKLPIVSLAILAGQIALAHQLDATPLGTIKHFQEFYTGVSMFAGGGFQPQSLIVGYAPWLVKRFVLPLARPRIGGMHLPVSIS